MKNKDILDLRFIIGLFFGVTGIILIIGSLILTTGVEKSEETNFWSGVVYVIFGLFMVILWTVGNKKKEISKEDENTQPEG